MYSNNIMLFRAEKNSYGTWEGEKHLNHLQQRTPVKKLYENPHGRPPYTIHTDGRRED